MSTETGLGFEGSNVLIEHGWLTGVRQTRSSNFNQRPPNIDISLVVVHNISLPPGEFGTGCVADFFQNKLDHGAHPFFQCIKGVEVSAHCFIHRDGTVEQFVSFEERAWHAGRSSFQGRDECNDFSIGIELEGTDDIAYCDEQYQSLSGVIRLLMKYYPAIEPSRVVGHCHIAPERKTDPGAAFDWPKLQLSIKR